MNDIQHRITRNGRHELIIQAQFPAGTDRVQLPMWRPGRYEPGNFGRLVRGMEQWDGTAWKSLKKEALHVWRCLAPSNAHSAVQVRYAFTAAKLDAGSTWADDHLLYVNPVNCLLFHPDLAETPITVQLPDVPAEWTLATALDSALTEHGRQLSADGTQHLMDSPWIAAPPEDLWHNSYTVQGHVFHVHVWGQRHFNEEQFTETHRRFTECQLKAFGWLPVQEYHFLYLFPEFPARHGVEHEASTVIAWGPARELTNATDAPSPGYEEVIDIASHELVHTWNVKWMRPAEWMPYDFSQASPSRMGYIAEGVTTYLGDLFLLESGVIDLSGWLRRFEKLLTRHLWNPGRLETSVADSSFDTWLDGYTLGVRHRRGNIYVEGAVLAFLCDITLNRAGAGWLIDALAELTGPQSRRSLTETDWWAHLERRAGEHKPEFAEEIAALRTDFCEGTAPTWPSIADALLHQGIQATLEPHQNPLARCGALCGKGREGRLEVKACWPDSPAWNVGLRTGDVIQSTHSENNALTAVWLRDAVHQEESTLTVPEGPGHFAHPVLTSLPG